MRPRHPILEAYLSRPALFGRVLQELPAPLGPIATTARSP